MLRRKVAAGAFAALALAAGPLAASPALAAETHPCSQLFAEPWDRVCAIPIRVYCLIFPTQAICH
ncbi:MAG TPA: hypothetical protein VG318_09535 [Actinomycetota bacterium]|nr:hypothetical protein [Actinomycetota bacterium]